MMKTAPTLLLAAGLALLLSCATPRADRPETPPGWINNRPADPLYYIGIGGSRSGDKGEDRQIARSRALAELSGEIYASLEGSLEITARDSSEEGESYLLRQNIIQKVRQDLESVETVAAWYSEEEGYWYYLRLSRARWEEIRQERALELTQRFTALLSGPFPDVLSELKALEQAYREYRENDTGREIRLALFGREGSADNLILSRAEELLGGLRLSDNPFPEEILQSSPASFTGTLGSPAGRTPGAFSLELYRDETLLGLLPLAPAGDFAATFPGPSDPGPRRYSLKLRSPFGHPELRRRLDHVLPGLSRTIPTTPLLVQLELRPLPAEETGGLYQSSLVLLEELSPFALTAAPQKNRLILRLTRRGAPPNEFGIFIAYSRGILSWEGPAGERILWEGPEEKQGGLTEEQAEDRAFRRVLEGMKGNQELKEILGKLSF